MMPGARVFLDVDDLTNIDSLEDSVRASRTVIFFLSRGFFRSPNVLREVVTTIRNGIPFVVVFETQAGKGGLTPQEYMDECLQCRIDEVVAAAPLLFGSWLEASPPELNLAHDATPAVLQPLGWFRERQHLEVTMLTLCNRLRSYGVLEPAAPQRKERPIPFVGSAEHELAPTLAFQWIRKASVVERPIALKEAAEGRLHAEYAVLVRLAEDDGDITLDKGLRVLVARGISAWDDSRDVDDEEALLDSPVDLAVIVVKIHPSTFAYGMIVDATAIQALLNARDMGGAAEAGAATSLLRAYASPAFEDTAAAAARLEGFTLATVRAMQLTHTEAALVHERDLASGWPLPLAEVAHALGLSKPFRHRALSLEEAKDAPGGQVLLVWSRDAAFDDAVADAIQNVNRAVVACMDADATQNSVPFYFLRACVPPRFAINANIMAALFGPIAKPLRSGIHSTVSWMDVSSAVAASLHQLEVEWGARAKAAVIEAHKEVVHVKAGLAWPWISCDATFILRHAPLGPAVQHRNNYDIHHAADDDASSRPRMTVMSERNLAAKTNTGMLHGLNAGSRSPSPSRLATTKHRRAPGTPTGSTILSDNARNKYSSGVAGGEAGDGGMLLRQATRDGGHGNDDDADESWLRLSA